MNFLKKIKKLLPFRKKQTISDSKRNEINRYFERNPELKEKFPDIYACYEKKIAENELDEMRNILNTYVNRESIRKLYLKNFEETVKWQEIYPQEYMQLQKEYE